jgi:hypothetical protein
MIQGFFKVRLFVDGLWSHVRNTRVDLSLEEYRCYVVMP